MGAHGSCSTDGYSSATKQALEAQHDLKHSLGLGHKPNTVPDGKADINGDQREIILGWHVSKSLLKLVIYALLYANVQQPVGGGAGKWFAEKTIIGKQITTRVGKYPDPSQHWGVIVGGYVHQLWMDEALNVIYFNEEFKSEDWHTFEVGKTRFNDQALRKAGR